MSTCTSNEFGDFNDSMSSVPAASGSKAVLAALRALQDKIRRLESERNQVTSECQQLRIQLRELEIDTEHTKQKEILNVSKHTQESRVAYERLVTEKTELETRLLKVEERNAKFQATADEMQMKMRSLEDDRERATMNLRDAESKLRMTEEGTHCIKEREKELLDVLASENARHEREIESINSRLNSRIMLILVEHTLIILCNILQVGKSTGGIENRLRRENWERQSVGIERNSEIDKAPPSTLYFWF